MQKEWNIVNKKAYEKKGKSYDFVRPLSMYKYLSKFFKKHLIKYMPKGSLLMDAGCGTGNSTHFLDNIAKNCTIHGYEQAKGMVDVAKTKKFSNKTIFYNTTIEEIKAKDKYDYIQLFQVIHHFKEADNALIIAKQALKKGGVLVLIDFFSNNKIVTIGNYIYCKFFGQGNYYTRNYKSMEEDLRRNNFKIIKKVTHPVLKNYGLIIAQK